MKPSRSHYGWKQQRMWAAKSAETRGHGGWMGQQNIMISTKHGGQLFLFCCQSRVNLLFVDCDCCSYTSVLNLRHPCVGTSSNVFYVNQQWCYVWAGKSTMVKLTKAAKRMAAKCKEASKKMFLMKRLILRRASNKQTYSGMRCIYIWLLSKIPILISCQSPKYQSNLHDL